MSFKDISYLEPWSYFFLSSNNFFDLISNYEVQDILSKSTSNELCYIHTLIVVGLCISSIDSLSKSTKLLC